MRARCGALVLAAAASGPNWRFLNWLLPKKKERRSQVQGDHTPERALPEDKQ